MLSQTNAASHDKSRQWFQSTYSHQCLLSPSSSRLDPLSMAFHSPDKCRGREPLRITRVHSASPSYKNPTVSSMQLVPTDDYAVGCSVCGTHSIETMHFTLNRSPPKLKAKRSGPVVDRDCGAYTQLLEVNSCAADAQINKQVKVVEYIEGGKFQGQKPFIDNRNPGDGLATTVLYNEVYPAAPPPLTPMNFEEARLVQESVLKNKAAERYVKEEQRKRAVVRRAEYANRDRGVSKLIRAVTKSCPPMQEHEEELGLTLDEEELTLQVKDSPRRSRNTSFCVTPGDSPIKFQQACKFPQPLLPNRLNLSCQCLPEALDDSACVNPDLNHSLGINPHLSLDAYILMNQDEEMSPADVPRIDLGESQVKLSTSFKVHDSQRPRSEYGFDLHSPVSATSMRTNKTTVCRNPTRKSTRKSTTGINNTLNETAKSGQASARRSLRLSESRTEKKSESRNATRKKQLDVKKSMQTMYCLLNNSAVIKGLRLLGGFSQYIEREGLIDLVEN